MNYKEYKEKMFEYLENDDLDSFKDLFKKEKITLDLDEKDESYLKRFLYSNPDMAKYLLKNDIIDGSILNILGNLDYIVLKDLFNRNIISNEFIYVYSFEGFDDRYVTLLFLAIMRNDFLFVRKMLKKGIKDLTPLTYDDFDLDYTYDDYVDSLRSFIIDDINSTKMFKLLLQYKIININDTTFNDESLLGLVIRKFNDIKFADFLISLGLKISDEDVDIQNTYKKLKYYDNILVLDKSKYLPPDIKKQILGGYLDVKPKSNLKRSSSSKLWSGTNSSFSGEYLGKSGKKPKSKKKSGKKPKSEKKSGKKPKSEKKSGKKPWI